MVQRIIVKLSCLAGELKKMFLAKSFHIELCLPQDAQLMISFGKSDGLHLLEELLYGIILRETEK